MTCYRCGDEIQEGQKTVLYGKILCEDCYIDTLSPAKACDPWAVYSAKSFAQQDLYNTEITNLQAKILQILMETGGVEPKVLSEMLQVKPSDLEREIATLRHMEKLRGEMRDGKKIICLW